MTSRPLPQPIMIPRVMTISTLPDVRKLLRHLPAQHHNKVPWRHLKAELDRGANVADVSIALRLALTLGGVKYLVKRTGQRPSSNGRAPAQGGNRGDAGAREAARCGTQQRLM